jgi:hypothetical protein
MFYEAKATMKRIKGYVATLDVLGFSELLQREGYAEQLKRYLDCVNDVIRPASVKAECVVFSDSIVLTSPGNNDAAFETAIRTCSAAFRALLKNEIPVRGAIAFGSYYREARAGSVFLAGRPIVEAYRCERSSDWVGILLCPSVIHQQAGLGGSTWIPPVEDLAAYEDLSTEEFDEAFSAIALRLQSATVPYLDSETKAVGELSGYAIVPAEADDTIDTIARTVASARRALDDLRLKAPRPRAQAKYRTSLSWLDDIQKRLTHLRKLYRVAKRKTEETSAS